MNPQDNNMQNVPFPEVKDTETLDEVVVSDGIGGNNLKSSGSDDLANHVAYITEEEIHEIRSREHKLRHNASAYDDLDDYIFKSKRRKRKVKRKDRSDNSIDNFIDSMYTNSKRNNKTSKHRKRRKVEEPKMKLWKKIVITFISIVLSVAIVSVSAIAILNNIGRDELLNNTNFIDVDLPEDASQYENGKFIVTPDGQRYQYNPNITSILCMGIDKKELGNNEVIGDGGSADALFLIVIDTSNGKTKILNISRDTMADICVYSTEGSYIGVEKQQICLAYSYGDGFESSCQNQVQAVSQLFYNIPINSYLALDLSGIGPINDSVGGVTVVSPETTKHFNEGETYHLQGKEAENFVRDRSHETVDGNNYRMERQKIYIEKFSEMLINQTKKDIKTPLSLFESANSYTCTNLNASKVTYLGLNAIRGQYNSGTVDIRKIEGKSKQGKEYAEFYIDEDKFFETFLDVFYLPVS